MESRDATAPGPPPKTGEGWKGDPDDFAGEAAGYEVGQSFNLDGEGDGGHVEMEKAPARITILGDKAKAAHDLRSKAPARRKAGSSPPAPFERSWGRSLALGVGQVFGSGLVLGPLWLGIGGAPLALICSPLSLGVGPAFLTWLACGGLRYSELPALAVLVLAPILGALALATRYRKGIRHAAAVWAVFAALVVANLLSLGLALVALSLTTGR